MKALVIAAFVIGISHAFIFTDECKTDDDCVNGCCVTSGDLFTSRQCVHRFLPYLHSCHLSGQESYTCGCSAGYHCEDVANLQGVALETNVAVGYGVCEQGSSNVNYTKPLIAVESG